MKRSRDHDEEAISSDFYNHDWTVVFRMTPVLQVLNRYLATLDILNLSCVNRYMYNKWIHKEERIQILDLRKRIKQAMRRKYAKKSPVLMLRKAALKALQPVSGTFCCFYCNCVYVCETYLANRRVFPYAMCVMCVTRSNHYVEVNAGRGYLGWIEEYVHQRMRTMPYPIKHRIWSVQLRTRAVEHVERHAFQLYETPGPIHFSGKRIHMKHLREAAGWVMQEFTGMNLEFT